MTNQFAWNSSTSSNWNKYNNDIFYHEVYFSPLAQPVKTIFNVDFAQPDSSKGMSITDNNQLKLVIHLALCIIVDDTISAAYSEHINVRLQLSSAINKIISETIIQNTSYNPNFIDFWVFNSEELEKTTGYINDFSKINQYITSLQNQGLYSNLIDCANIAISGLSAQSVLESIYRIGDDSGNMNRINQLISYLSTKQILNLNDIKAYWTSLGDAKSNWNTGNNHTDSDLINTIYLYSDVAQYVVKKFSLASTPYAIIVADGDSVSGNPEDIVLSTVGGWQDENIPVHCFGLGTGHDQSALRTVSDKTGGKHFFLTKNKTWSDLPKSLMHGGDNSIFTGFWSKRYDYDQPTWIDTIDAAYTSEQIAIHHAGVSASCIIQVRWSTDRVNFTPWTNVYNNVSLPVKTQILVLEYHINMQEGYDQNQAIQLHPSIASLSHTIINPSIKYYLTTPQTINGMLLEYILSDSISLPQSARATWGIVRGESVDFADYEIILNNNRAAMPNRQSSITFRPAIVQSGLNTTTTDYVAYQVLDNNGIAARWSTTDQIAVNSSGYIITPNSYTYDNNLGIIYFLSTQSAATTFTVDITTPAQIYQSTGEHTTTIDGRTYYLVNGKFTPDATIIVLINNQIKRGGYFVIPEEGCIIFEKERDFTDIVNVFVLHAGTYRVAVKIENYGTDSTDLSNFGLYYSQQSNTGLLFEYNNSPIPYVASGSVKLSNSATPSISNRLVVSYDYISTDGNEESGSQISWWRKRVGENISNYSIVNNGFVRICTQNNLPDYDNRITQQLSDTGVGGIFQSTDQVYAIVIPSDGLTLGKPEQSSVYTMANYAIPYLSAVPVIDSMSKAIGNDGYSYAQAGSALSISYTQIGTPDLAQVVWINRDGANPISVEHVIPAGVTIAGQIISAVITPNNGTISGSAVQSDIMIIK